MTTPKYSTLVPPAYTGVVFLLSWIYLLFYANTAGIEAAAPISLYSAGYSISAAAMVVTLMLLAFAPFDTTKLLIQKATKIATPLALSVGTLLIMAGGFDYGLAFVWSGGLITGVFSGVMAQQWVVAYKRVSLKTAISSFPTLMAMAVGMCLTLMYLPRTCLLVATVVFPLISEVMFHVVRKKPYPEFEVEAAEHDAPINFVLLLLPFAVYAASSGYLDFSSANNNYTFVFYGLMAFIPLLIAGVYIFLVERTTFLMTVVIPLSVLVAVFVPFLSLSGLAPLAHFISIGELGIEVLIFIVVVAFSEFFALSALKTYALGRAVITIINSVGWYAASYLNDEAGTLLSSQVSLVAIFLGVEVMSVALIVAIIKAQKGTHEGAAIPASTEAVNTEPERGDTVSAADKTLQASGLQDSQNRSQGTLQDACRRIGDRQQLSKRELDVFMLLARGYSSASIQNELFIAAGTVNYHMRNIYAKLRVHSKQEVIDLVEAETAGK